MLSEGSKAPDFTLPAASGETVSLGALKGAPVVVFFYPKDDTPGCTTENIAFSALSAEFAALDAKVLGISKDSIAKHCKFRDKHGLTVELLSDEGSDVCEGFGVWGEKSMYGKTFMGITRATFLLDGEGTVVRVWPKVKVAGHAEEVLEATRALAG